MVRFFVDSLHSGLGSHLTAEVLRVQILAGRAGKIAKVLKQLSDFNESAYVVIYSGRCSAGNLVISSLWLS